MYGEQNQHSLKIFVVFFVFTVLLKYFVYIIDIINSSFCKKKYLQKKLILYLKKTIRIIKEDYNSKKN